MWRERRACMWRERRACMWRVRESINPFLMKKKKSKSCFVKAVCILPFAARVTRAQNRHTVRHTCRQRERVLAFQEASEAFLVGLFEDRPTSSASEVSWKARMTPSPLPFLHFCKCRGLAGGGSNTTKHSTTKCMWVELCCM